jgi:uncharacterized protein (TIGR03437 family)
MAATFGTVVATTPAADIVLDQTRTPNRLYLLEPTTGRIEVYSTSGNLPNLISRVNVDATPTSMAMSRSGQYLYVACYGASALDIIDLNKLAKVNTINLGANPWGVAVGYDDKVLISTIGGAGKSVLAVYDPNANAANALTGIAVAPPAPTAATLPAPSNIFLARHASLAATRDGKIIAGVHMQANNTRTVFTYDVASATVLAARNFPTASPTLAISDDGSKIVSGPLLLDTVTLSVLGTQNTANSPYVFPAGANFNVQTAQGGAVFAPDGSRLYAAYNIVPTLSPAALANTSQLVFDTPDNLLIKVGIQMVENLNGKMAISSDGATIYALSQSGFMVLPLRALQQSSPVAAPDSNVALLASDQCGVTAAQNTAVIPVRNTGGGSRMTVTAQVLSSTATSTSVTQATRPYGGDVTARFNAAAARTMGTATPDLLLIQSPEAVNIVPSVRVFENSRNAEARGSIVPVDIGATTTGLTDMVQDTVRRRLYIANPALNRIEVFDMQGQRFGTPINAGQLPRSMALAGDGNTLYIANNGSENVTALDLTKNSVSTVKFPPLPFNSTAAVITPLSIAYTQHGVQVLMSNGSLWTIVGPTLVPRVLDPLIFGTATTVTGPNQQLVASPDGAYVLLLAGNGVAYLYSAADDAFVQQQTVIPVPIQNYFGPVAAGPNGAYYLVDDRVLDSSLTTISAGTNATIVGPVFPVPGPGGGFPPPGGPTISTTGATRPISAVAAATATAYVRFSTPLRANATATVTDAGLVEVVDLATGRVMASTTTLEGPLTQVTGVARVNANGRTMAVDATAGAVYALTASGLSIIPMNLSPTPPPIPQVPANGVVNTANFRSGVAPGGLISIFGQNLAATVTAGIVPLPTMLGGTCVTLNNAPLPLLASSAGQINAQLPPTLAAGTYPLVVRSVSNQAASGAANLSVAKYAPAIFMDSQGPAIFHRDGTRVTPDNPASRDESLTMYATGLGVTTGGRVTAGGLSPSSPLAVTAPLQVFFGNPTISYAGIIVDWSGLLPGSIGVYQINIRVPGTHVKGNALPVTLRIGGVSSPTTGANVATVAVN